jgi:hypothetical protein
VTTGGQLSDVAKGSVFRHRRHARPRQSSGVPLCPILLTHLVHLTSGSVGHAAAMTRLPAQPGGNGLTLEIGFERPFSRSPCDKLPVPSLPVRGRRRFPPCPTCASRIRAGGLSVTPIDKVALPRLICGQDQGWCGRNGRCELTSATCEKSRTAKRCVGAARPRRVIHHRFSRR